MMTNDRKIILASASPSRKELLEKAGLTFAVEVSNYKEDNQLPLSPRKLVQFLSAEKAKAVGKRHQDAIVIGADTVGVLKGTLLGKPKSKVHAKKMLRDLSGKSHMFITGFTIIDTKTSKKITQFVETKVYFRKLTDTEINAYIASGEAMGHAGSYAIQGLGMQLVKKIEGDYPNVAGLPVAKVVETLKKFGIETLV